MKKFILTTVIFLLGGIYFNTFAQEELLWKAQQYQRAENSQSEKYQTQNSDQYNSEEFLALQIQQKDPETKQQKDPENPASLPITDSMEEDSQEDNTRSDEIILQKPQQISPDRSQTVQQPFVNQTLKTKGAKESAQEDDSVLEFNFLYFIIHKFKLSDILE